LIHLQWGKTKSGVKIKPEEKQHSWGKTKYADLVLPPTFLG